MRILAAIALLPIAVYAQLGASAGTNRVYVSETITEPAWKRQVVMRHEPDGKIFNDNGAVGDAAEAAAAGQAADSAAEIAEAAHDSMTNQVRRLNEAAATASTNALAISLIFRPETSRTNLTFYVVKTETDGIVDTQWVWCNWSIDFPPNRFVVYQTFGQCSTNKFEWDEWSASTNITVNGRTWQGCHKGHVTRPTWAQSRSCLDLPNDRLGGANGFDFGDLTITINGRTPYTGFVTNGITGEVLYFDKGFNMGDPTEGL